MFLVVSCLAPAGVLTRDRVQTKTPAGIRHASASSRPARQPRGPCASSARRTAPRQTRARPPRGTRLPPRRDCIHGRAAPGDRGSSCRRTCHHRTSQPRCRRGAPVPAPGGCGTDAGASGPARRAAPAHGRCRPPRASARRRRASGHGDLPSCVPSLAVLSRNHLIPALPAIFRLVLAFITLAPCLELPTAFLAGSGLKPAPVLPDGTK